MTIIQQPPFFIPKKRDKKNEENKQENKNLFLENNIQLFSKELGISEREFKSALEKTNFTNLRQTIFNTLELIFKKDESKLKEIQLLRKNYV